MTQFHEYDVVRIVNLKSTDRSFDGTAGCMRAPQVGDEATICHCYDSQDPEAPFILEMVNADGLTVWLADFSSSELELISRSHG